MSRPISETNKRNTRHARFLSLETQLIEQEVCTKSLGNPSLMGLDDDDWNQFVLDAVFAELYLRRTTDLRIEKEIKRKLSLSDPRKKNQNTQEKISVSRKRTKKLRKKIRSLVYMHENGLEK